MYKKLGDATDLAMYCYHIAINNNRWEPVIGWEGTPVPISQVLTNKILKQINFEFSIARAGILKMDPYQMYHWHIDDTRMASINMLLTTNSRSHCLFGTPKNADNIYFTELKYEPNTLYLFNTQKLHTVINFEEPRYLFSLEFKSATYDELTEYLS